MSEPFVPNSRKAKRRDKMKDAAPWCALCGVELEFCEEHVRQPPENMAVFRRLYRRIPDEHKAEVVRRGLTSRALCICRHCSVVIDRDNQRRSGPPSVKTDSAVKFLKQWYQEG